MKDILQILNEAFQGEYAFLRLGSVQISPNDKTIHVTFLLPEDKFNYSFRSADIEKIENAVKEAVEGEYKVVCKFQKIILSEEVFKNALIEHMEKYFPLIAANIDYSKLTITIGDEVIIHITVEENIYNYMPTVSFEKRIREFAENKYVVQVRFEYDVLPDEIRTKRFESNQANRYGKTVQVTDKKVIFGKESDLLSPAVHISTLRGDGQDAICCGKVKFLRYNTRDESKKKEGKRFYKNYYTFSISDHTGFLNVFINLNGEIPLLQDGVDVICRGRVNLRDDMTSYGMYARAVALCTIPYEVIREQTKPLAPPEEYSLLKPQPYEEQVYAQLSLTASVKQDAAPVFIEPTVAVSIRSIKTDRNYVPYEVAMCHIEGDKIVSYVHTYLKVAFTEKSERAQYANAKGYASPRLSSIIPDLIKYTEGKTLVAVNPKYMLDLLNETAVPLRYRFTNETKVFSDPIRHDGEGIERNALDDVIEMARVLLGKTEE